MRAIHRFVYYIRPWSWYLLTGVVFGSLFLFAWYGLKPASSKSIPVVIEIKGGEGFFAIMKKLGDQGLFRAPIIAKLYGLLSGQALRLHTGVYALAQNESVPRIFGIITEGQAQEVEIRIPEGASVFVIDNLLSSEGVVHSGELVALDHTASLEGMLFPDTYRFLLGSTAAQVAEKMKANFEEKTKDIFAGQKNVMHYLVLASLLEREVPEYHDRQIVAGILEKRLKANMPLQLDATICYIKQSRDAQSCYPLTALDFTVDSPYNTYVYRGLPPRPIGSPGVDALMAALRPISSPYWFYLSDPVSKKTVFAETLDSHSDNRIKYLNVIH